jgi:hypothetical protein
VAAPPSQTSFLNLLEFFLDESIQFGNFLRSHWPGTCGRRFRLPVAVLLPHFWWFIGIGGIASYILMAFCLMWALSDVGITGNLTGAPNPALDPLTMRYLSLMLVWLAGITVVLFMAQHFLSKI